MKRSLFWSTTFSWRQKLFWFTAFSWRDHCSGVQYSHEDKKCSGLQHSHEEFIVLEYNILMKTKNVLVYSILMRGILFWSTTFSWRQNCSRKENILLVDNILMSGRDISVGIVTGYGPDGRGGRSSALLLPYIYTIRMKEHCSRFLNHSSECCLLTSC
jgi:hypothetical protein